MKTVNNISGGRTSAYLAAHYPADYNLFALVRTNDKDCIYPDEKIRQIISDKIGCEFIGTLEDDKIIHTILDLEQYLGKEIEWITSKYSFEEIITKQKVLPNPSQRFCTNMLKIIPMQEWWYKKFDSPIEVRIGFRANEQNRKQNTLYSLNERGFISAKVIIGKHKNGNNKWKEFDWQKPSFPLIDDIPTYKDEINNYWKNKPVRFAAINNCVGCFNQNPILLRKRFDWHPNKMNWFIKQEKIAEHFVKKINGERSQYTKWNKNYLYEEVKNHKLQIEIFENDFNECDSGYCGL